MTASSYSGDVHTGNDAWRDGSVGSFDGIYQVVNAAAGEQFNLGFWLVSPSAFETGPIETAAYFGLCNASGAACVTSLGTGFVVQTPSSPSSGVINTTGGDITPNTFSLASLAASANPVQFDGGILQISGGALPGNIVTAPVSIDANNGFIDTSTGNGGFSGNVSGPGSLTIGGGGAFSLTGANTFAGGTTINGSTVAVGTASALGTGALTLNGGQLQAAVDGLTIGNAAVLTGIAAIDTQGFGLTYAGVINGPGALTKVGAGTLLLTGANSYAGGTTVQAGTLAVANNGALGTGAITFNAGTLQAAANGLTLGNAAALAANATIDTQGFGLTSTGVIAGPGQLTKVGAGTLLLTGANSYAGGTTVQAGTLAIANNGALGTGAVIVNGGTLQAAADGLTLGNAAILAANATIDTQGFGLASTGVMSGPGALTKIGAGTLLLTGANSYAGGTTVLSGTLAVASSTALGTGPLVLNDLTTLQLADGVRLANAIALSGTQDPIIDTGSGSEALNGPISGPGALTKLGSGTLDLTGTDTYTGPTTVAAGTLLVDGDLVNSVVTVENGAEVGGTGSIASLVINGGATLAATSAKPLAIAGNVNFLSGSTYQVTLNADGTSGKLTIGGTASLGGATLSVLAGAGAFSARSYEVLTAAGGVSGTFAAVAAASNLAVFDPRVSYGANDVTLTLQPANFASAAATSNQAAVAGSVQALGLSSPIYNAVAGLGKADAQGAFTALSGVSHASTTSIVASNVRVATGLVVDRLWDVSGSGLSAQQVLDQFAPDRMPALVRCYGPVAEPVPAAPPPSYTAWGEAFGSFGHTDGGANAGALDRSLGGFVLGVDAPLSGIAGNAWRGGIAGGYTDTTFHSHLDGGTGSVQGVFGSLYGGARYGAVDIRIGSTLGGTFVDAQRTVAFPGVFESERSFNRGVTVQTFAEVGYRIPTASFVIEPVAGAAFLYSHQEGFSETGGAAALTVAPLSTDLGTTTLGFRGEMQPFKTLPIITHAYLAWQHVIGNVSPATTLAFEAAPSNTFSVSGTPIDRNAVAAELAVDYRASAKLDFGLSYTGLVGATAADHSIKGRAEYRF